jgi:xanthine/uracil/vitamin C permease (AzgA family)
MFYFYWFGLYSYKSWPNISCIPVQNAHNFSYFLQHLYQCRRKGAFLMGIAFVTIVSWFRNTAVTYFPYTEDGDARFAYFSQVVSIEPVNLIFAQYTSNLSQVALALITFLYVDFLDTSGTLFALASSLGYIDEKGDFPKSRWAFTADALATSFGSLFGLSPITSFVESAAGVEAGARTGLASCFCGLFFFLSIFFAPIIASIPPWATGGCLVIVSTALQGGVVGWLVVLCLCESILLFLCCETHNDSCYCCFSFCLSRRLDH